MTQSRLSSLYEAGFNILIGYAINFTANMLILPTVGFNITIAQNLWIGLLFTIVSLVWQYVIRRWFNKKLHEAAQRLASS